MSTNNYAIDYIKRATSSASIEQPDPKRAGTDYQILLGIHEAHKLSGAKGAAGAWSALKKTAPHLDRKSRRIHADELKYIAIPDYAVDEYPIYLQGTNLLIGTRGAGKSLLALDIVAKIAMNNPSRSIVYCAGEAIAAYGVRWEAWKKHNHAHPKNVIFWDGALQLLNPGDVAEFMADIQDDKPCFVVIDTVARSMAGSNENDTAVMSQYVAAAEQLTKELHAGLLLVHHEGRNGMQRGSSALDGAVDSVISLKRDDQFVMLHNDLASGGKNRHRAEAEPRALDFYPVEIEINGQLRESVVLIPVSLDNTAPNYTDAQCQIIEALQGSPKSMAEIIKETGMSRPTFYRNIKGLTALNAITVNRKTGIYDLVESHTHPHSETVRQNHS